LNLLILFGTFGTGLGEGEARVGGRINIIFHSIVLGKPERKMLLGRPRRRWDDNIRRGLRELDVRDENWPDVAQDIFQWRTFVTAAMNLRVL